MRLHKLLTLLPVLTLLAAVPAAGRAGEVGASAPSVVVDPIGPNQELPGTAWSRQDNEVTVQGITARVIGFTTYATIQPLRPRPGLLGPQARLGVYCARGSMSVEISFLTPIGTEGDKVMEGRYQVDQRAPVDKEWELSLPDRRLMRADGPAVPALVESMLDASRLAVEATLRDHGLVVVGFDVTGLRAAMMSRREECGLI